MMNKSFISSLLVVLVSALVLTGTSVTAQDWDGGDATNNDDGGNDNGAPDGSQTTTDSDTSTSGSWDGGNATNDDDGSGTKQTWDGGDATNDDDGTSTTNQWDGGDATNNDDGGSTGWDGGDANNNDDGNSDSSSTSNSDTNSDSGGSGDGEIENANIEVMQPEMTVEMAKTATVGEEVDVTGHVDYPRIKQVEVMLDGRTVQQTAINDQNDFATRFTVDEAGEHTVMVKTKKASVEKQLKVTSGVDVSNIQAPEQVESGNNVNICADVSSAGEPTVELIVDGNVAAEQRGTGQKCFQTDLSQGTHTITVEAEIDGETASDTAITTVNGDGTDTVARDLSADAQSAGLFQSLVQMIASMIRFMVNLVPAL